MAATVSVRDIFVEANGIRHHLIARGNPTAPAVMMIHGLTQQAHVFDAIATRLSSRLHVYCLDVRGRGESEWGPPDGYNYDTYVADLEALRQALGLERFALVGTSMGGLISMYYAARHPEPVTRVVLNDVGPELDPRGAQRIMGYLLAGPEAFPDMKAVVRYYRENYAPMLGRLSDDQLAEYGRWHVRLSDSGVYVWKMDQAIRRPVTATAPQQDPWEAYRAINRPILLLRGAESDILSPETAQKMLETNAGCSVVEVPGVGHAPSLMEPVALKALEDFLAV